MKKQNLKHLALNKKSVANFDTDNVKGGFGAETKTFVNGGLCQCPAPSRADTASWCICL